MEYEATITVSQGNKKMGKTPNFSLVAGDSCPGASELCARICYAKKGFILFQRGRYEANQMASESDTFVTAMVERIAKATAKMPYPSFRIHVSGDFYGVGYVNKWAAIAKRLPGVRLWAYTRSWTVSGILPALEILQDLPNVQLFASVDDTMGDPPQGWRVAYIETDSRSKGLVCPEQTGKKPDCATCHYCYQGTKGDVVFKVH